MTSRWKKINQELKKISPPEEFDSYITPFRNTLRSTLTQMNSTDLRLAYREVRAALTQELRANLALLDAAAHEEELLTKK